MRSSNAKSGSSTGAVEHEWMVEKQRYQCQEFDWVNDTMSPERRPQHMGKIRACGRVLRLHHDSYPQAREGAKRDLILWGNVTSPADWNRRLSLKFKAEVRED